MKPTKKDRTRREIMEAAKDIIREKGHDALTVRYLHRSPAIPTPISTTISGIFPLSSGLCGWI